MAKKVKITPINFEYFERRCAEENIGQTELSKLLGRSPSFLSYHKKCNCGIPTEDLKRITELIDLDMKQLVAHDEPYTDEPKEVPTTKETDMDAVSALIVTIGELEARVVRLEERVEKPAIVTIPMNAKDMAILTMRDLLDGGWTTKDDVLRAFNEKHIPIEHISAALKANNAVSATSGVAEKARTFYIAMGGEQ